MPNTTNTLHNITHRKFGLILILKHEFQSYTSLITFIKQYYLHSLVPASLNYGNTEIH